MICIESFLPLYLTNLWNGPEASLSPDNALHTVVDVQFLVCLFLQQYQRGKTRDLGFNWSEFGFLFLLI